MKLISMIMCLMIMCGVSAPAEVIKVGSARASFYLASNAKAARGPINDALLKDVQSGLRQDSAALKFFRALKSLEGFLDGTLEYTSEQTKFLWLEVHSAASYMQHSSDRDGVLTSEWDIGKLTSPQEIKEFGQVISANYKKLLRNVPNPFLKVDMMYDAYQKGLALNKVKELGKSLDFGKFEYPDWLTIIQPEEIQKILDSISTSHK